MLYDFCEICDAIMARKYEKALEIFHSKAESGINEAKLFLHSMNCAIYNLILHETGLALYECYNINHDEINSESSQFDLCGRGKGIIDTYCKYVQCKKRCCKYIEAAVEYIENNISEELSLERLAGSLFVSKCYLSPEFLTLIWI